MKNFFKRAGVISLLMVYTIFSGVSGSISSLFMLRNKSFSKATAYMGSSTDTPFAIFNMMLS